MTQDQIDGLDAVLQSLHRIRQDNYAVETIVIEEAATCFNGDKTAEEAAEIIQSRVQIYVNENR